MMFYVTCKQIIFNSFATIKLPLDLWSRIDIFCALSNITCIYFLTTITENTIIDLNDRKVYYNILMLFIITATWARIVGLFFVIKSLSILCMTAVAMFAEAGTFVFIIFCYLFITATLFCVIF